MSEFDQMNNLRVSDQILVEMEGRSALNEYGEIVTWHARVADGEVDATITVRSATLRERLLWALQPKRRPVYLR